jgi:serine/threonine protein kinase
VYEAVLERPARERGQFLAVACAGDDSLSEEVRSLLSQDGRQSLLDNPVWVSGDLLAPPHTRLEAGSRLGPYEIQSVLGSGGMGDVYRAVDTRLHRAVAIKVLKPDVAADGEFRARFDREARTISQLDHPNICTLYDVGEEGGTAFLVMQYLDGVPLSQRIRRGAVPAGEVLGIGISLASALTYAHGHGILHRDIKPQNVIMLPDGRVKLLDFGIAKPYGARQMNTEAETSAAFTRLGQTLGTLEYMSPEQLSGHEVDGRSDMFSLGLVLHELCTGTHPFQGQTPVLTASAILEAKYPGLPDVPGPTAGLDRVLRRMLSRAAADRYPTMADCLADLRHLEQGTRPRPIDAHSAGTSSAARRWLLGGMGALGAAAALTLLFSSMRGGPAQPVSEPASTVTEAAVASVAAPVTSVSYWLDVDPPAALRAEAPAFRSLGDQVYPSGWRFRVNVQAPGPGHVYLVADEPRTPEQTGLALLYASTAGARPDSGGGTAVTTDWFVFTGAPAREHLWLVWSATPIAELAGLATLINPLDRGVIRNEDTAARVRALLTGETARATTVAVDRGAIRATLTSPEPLAVHRLELQHD